jgi:hypothetical protein
MMAGAITVSNGKLMRLLSNQQWSRLSKKLQVSIVGLLLQAGQMLVFTPVGR